MTAREIPACDQGPSLCSRLAGHHVGFRLHQLSVQIPFHGIPVLSPSVFFLPLTQEGTKSPDVDGEGTPSTAGRAEKVPHSVRVMLSGGPDWVTVPVLWEVTSLETEPKVKILCGNAYEHFEFSGSYSVHGEEQLPVYRWCRRTYVAE
ncbi:DUF5988 family protein [Streptomyces sp. NPDC051987]|uniref:DUF5988 family protein n=1 Tax=Streptomyces sp. NPDC051987 TaxID=3155808 RepID=UPI003449F3BD